MMCQANSTAGCEDGVATADASALHPGDGDGAKRYPFEPTWTLTPPEKLVVALTLAFSRHASECMRRAEFTDDELLAVAKDALEQLAQRSDEEPALAGDTDGSASQEASLTHKSPQNYEAKAREIADKVFDLLDDTIPDHKGVLSAISSAISSAVQAERERIRGMLVSKADALAIEAQIPGDPSRTAILMAKGQAYAEASSLLSAVSDADVEEGIRIAREIRPAIEAEIASAIRKEDATNG